MTRKDKRNFIIFYKHRRWQRLWQFFFTGWGLVMIASLVAGTLFTHQLLWSPITAINMTDIISNQFKMSGASFEGVDEHGEPFKIMAQTGRQEYEKPNIIYLDRVSGYKTQNTNGKNIVYNFSANSGEYDRTHKTITLSGHVRIKSSDGHETHANQLVIRI